MKNHLSGRKSRFDTDDTTGAHALDIETTEISMFFAHTDEAAVFQTLNRLDQIRYRNNFQFFILNLIREEFLPQIWQ